MTRYNDFYEYRRCDIFKESYLMYKDKLIYRIYNKWLVWYWVFEKVWVFTTTSEFKGIWKYKELYRSKTLKWIKRMITNRFNW